MPEAELHRLLTMAVFVAAGVLFFVFGVRPAPYGRHARPGYGPVIGERLGWLLMGAPAVLVFVWVFARGRFAGDTIPLLFAALWCGHFLYRAFIYPFRRRPRPGHAMPLVGVLAGLSLHVACAYLNARWLTELGPGYGWRWLLTFRFLYGGLLMVTGLGINRWADGVLRKLRRAPTDDYAIPRGGLYDDISCPNYLGEILQWLGWAIATWSLAGLALATMTAALLVPRAVSHHRWYQRRFPDYPRRRHALIPFVL
jgi:protein-S-isoprenylcysteine O-methyltransferase Ste14